MIATDLVPSDIIVLTGAVVVLGVRTVVTDSVRHCVATGPLGVGGGAGVCTVEGLTVVNVGAEDTMGEGDDETTVKDDGICEAVDEVTIVKDEVGADDDTIANEEDGVDVTIVKDDEDETGRDEDMGDASMVVVFVVTGENVWSFGPDEATTMG